MRRPIDYENLTTIIADYSNYESRGGKISSGSGSTKWVLFLILGFAVLGIISIPFWFLVLLLSTV